MAKILSYGGRESDSSKGPFKTIWNSFNSLDKFIKFYLVFALLVAIATPTLISGYLIFNPKAADITETSAPYPLPILDPNLDADNDGFTNGIEQYVGTDPLKNCPDVQIAIIDNNPKYPNSFWPPDLTGDNKVDREDSEAFQPYFSKRTTDVGFNKRFDLNKNGLINGQDVLMLNKFMYRVCNIPATATKTPSPTRAPISVPIGEDPIIIN